MNLAGHPGVDFEDGRTGTFPWELRLGIWCSAQASHFTHGQRLTLRRNASQGPKRRGLLRLRNLLICIEMVNRRTVLQTKLPACQSQRDGRLPVSWHTKGLSLGWEYFKTEMTKMADSIYEELRAMPSFCILNWRVDRFIARRAAAPFGPATTQLHSLRASRIC